MTSDIKNMHFGDLKNKLLKLSQAYNTEKKKNKFDDSVLTKAHHALGDMPKLRSRLAEVEQEHQMNAQKLLKY